MKIELLKPWNAGSTRMRPVGAVMNIDNETARQLIAGGVAKEYVEGIIIKTKAPAAPALSNENVKPLAKTETEKA